MTPVRLLYLVSRYPAVSHTFILREVRRLRSAGIDILPVSVNSPDRPLTQMSHDEFDETRRTFYLKTAGIEAAARAQAWALTTRPLQWLRGLKAAWQLRGAFGLARSLAYFVEAGMVARHMASEGVDHVHVHFGTAAASVALILRRGYDVRLSMTVHGPDEFDDVPGQALREKIAAADGIVCISQFARSQLMRLGRPEDWAKMRVVRLGVDPARHHPPAEPADDDALNILCVGRLTPAKGQRLLVEALPRLRARHPQARLTMVGAGPDEAMLRQRVEELGLDNVVVFTGPQTENQVLAHMHTADIFALPSLAEGIPVVLMEAMACGVPCVSTTVNGIPELIEHDRGGLLCPPGDLEALIAALDRLLADESLRQRLSVAGRARVLTNYDLDRNVHELSHSLREFHRQAQERHARRPVPAWQGKVEA